MKNVLIYSAIIIVLIITLAFATDYTRVERTLSGAKDDSTVYGEVFAGFCVPNSFGDGYYYINDADAVSAVNDLLDDKYLCEITVYDDTHKCRVYTNDNTEKKLKKVSETGYVGSTTYTRSDGEVYTINGPTVIVTLTEEADFYENVPVNGVELDKVVRSSMFKIRDWE